MKHTILIKGYMTNKQTETVGETLTRTQVRNEIAFLLSKLEDENLNRESRLQYASDDLYNWINSVIAQAKQEAVETRRTNYKKDLNLSIGLLRQWLNEKPQDLVVTNEHILEFLEDSLENYISLDMTETTSNLINKATIAIQKQGVGSARRIIRQVVEQALYNYTFELKEKNDD